MEQASLSDPDHQKKVENINEFLVGIHDVAIKKPQTSLSEYLRKIETHRL